MQAFGLGAFLTQHASCFFPNGKHILKGQTVACTLWGIYWLMLGLPAVAGICFIAAVRNIISSSLSAHHLKPFNVFITALMMLNVVYLWQGLIDALLIFIQLTVFMRVTSRDNLPRFHAWGSVTSILWLAYSLEHGAIFGALNEIVGFTVYMSAYLMIYYKTHIRRSAPLPA